MQHRGYKLLSTQNVWPLFVIGLSGATASGKTTLAAKLQHAMHIQTIVPLDLYFYSKEEMKQLNISNKETPQALRFARFLHDLTHVQVQQPLLLVEGFLLYHHPSLITLYDVPLFVHASKQVCAQRRQHRSQIELHRTWNAQNFEQMIWPSYEYFHAYLLDKQNEAVYTIDGNQSEQHVWQQAWHLLQGCKPVSFESYWQYDAPDHDATLQIAHNFSWFKICIAKQQFDIRMEKQTVASKL